jgi:2,4-dienoyl-CoA reductase-like NADH-dependent reductase (Old Yellow Enzyme family)
MDLFSPVSLGAIELKNRVVMAPLTRTRAGESGVPNDLLVEHYAQRAGTGLLITEGTYPSFESQAFVGQPGIVTAEQIAGWRRVTDAVHAAGGRIVMQVMNGGRVTHPGINGGRRVVAPSPIAVDGEVRTLRDGKQPFPVPHALATEELPAVRDEFVAAARNAIDAGMDGIELHGANGYLLHQFLSPASNRRDDAYGGSAENRIRFVVDVVREVAEEIGASRVGLRLSPAHNIQGVLETDADDVVETYSALADELAPLGLAYVSILHSDPEGELVQTIRRRMGAPFIANSGFGRVTTRDEAIHLIQSQHADAVAVGRALIANPDLVARWQGGHPENEPDPSTFYGPSAEGYTDYPRLTA